MIEPFRIAVPEEQIVDLSRRLAMTRWPDRELVPDGSQGVRLAAVRALCDYWQSQYDWRRCEAFLNAAGQYRTTIDGLGIHFLHIRSPEVQARPLIMTHGWPGSVIEFHKVIGPLTDPVAHGGMAEDAFHLVLPSLPGYGYSDKPREVGCNIERVARLWNELMSKLGYQRYFAQGGDWGAIVTTALGALRPAGLEAIHVNMPIGFPDEDARAEWTDQEVEFARDQAEAMRVGTGYALIQSTRPQTLGYGLTDSPAGQAAWILEKLTDWSDCGGDPFSLFNLDEMIDNIMLYWLPGAATSSARLYWESLNSARNLPVTDIPAGCSVFPKEVHRTSRRWAERTYTDLRYWNELDRGGHFAAFEQPALFVDEVRSSFRQFRLV
jgi:pimeloyl-ACP methyl ester carboxylesterase